MSNLIRAMQTGDTTTTNGALAHSTTSSTLVDFYFHINAMRASSKDEVLSLWTQAYATNRLDALRILFYSRDVRGGQGERKTFRTILEYLAERDPDAVRKNLHLIPEYGRWDDVLTLADTPLEDEAFAFIRQALASGDGLCAKWMPREKSSNGKLARKLAKAMDLSPKQYRKLLSGLTKVVESRMCDGEWEDIVFEHVPSYAMKNYRNAFSKYQPDRWEQYVSDLSEGKTTVNASTLYPHDLVRPFLGYSEPSNYKLLDAQWKALPNYMEGNNEIVLPVCDVSGSMHGTPMEVCIALGMYVSERNEGIFKDAFITFSSEPKMQYILGNSLSDRVRNLSRAEWGMSTDLEKTFVTLLNKAVSHKVPADKMPTMILIMSDMQFNRACTVGNVTMFDRVRQLYSDAGYELPKLVFWNLRAVVSNNPVKFDESGVALVSGYSPSLLKSLLSGKDITPYDVMRTTIDSDRYSAVTV